MTNEPDKFYKMEVSLEFETESVLNTLFREIETFCKNHGITKVRFSKVELYTHCKLCGRPRYMQTLGVDGECKPSHYRSCQAWQDRGGWVAAS